MNKPELLAPAGSLIGVRAAVQHGATAVYMGFGTFNARRGAKNFTHDEMKEAIAYCRARGVKTNITLNVLIFDREMEQAIADAKFLYEAGADALIVQDLGLALALKQYAPEIELHGSTQMSIHNADGAQITKKLGFSRVVLSRECSLAEIEHVTRTVDIETEVFVHGALCMCYSGQCYFSAVLGRRSGNRGLCAQPCRLRYQCAGKTNYPLSLKDLSAAGHLSTIAQAGVSSLKIEGRMKRPEYAAIVTQVFARLLAENRTPTQEESQLLTRVFSRDGFTDGYLTAQKGKSMFGTKTDVPLEQVQELYNDAATKFAEGKEAPLVPITLQCTVTAQGAWLTAWDAQDNVVCVSDENAVEKAKNRPTTVENLQNSLKKTGGTPFYCDKIEISLQEGLMLPNARVNALRRTALVQLLEKRAQSPLRIWNDSPDLSVQKSTHTSVFLGYTIEVCQWEQITDEILLNPPETLYIPLHLVAENCKTVQKWVQSGVCIGAVLPRIYTTQERGNITKQLDIAVKFGVSIAYANNLAHFELLASYPLEIHGGYGLNCVNSHSLRALNQLGATRQMLSFELRLEQVRDLQKSCQTELLIYGKLPLMLMENCAIYQSAGYHACKKGTYYLTDRKGARFAVLPELGCRNTLYNSTPLFLSREEVCNLGISYGRILFSDENSAECDRIWSSICNGEAPPSTTPFTRGLYRRGVE